jgi:hypothetical protein
MAWHDPNEGLALTRDVFDLIDATASLVADDVVGRYVDEYGEIGMPAHVARRLELHEDCAEALCPGDDELLFEDPAYVPMFAATAWRNAILSEWVFA